MKTLSQAAAESSTNQYISAANFAKVYVGLGDNEEALAQLEIACQERAVRLPWLLSDPILKHMHRDVRFQDICRRVGLAVTQ